MGEDNLQQVDYGYTVHGWLKAINSLEGRTSTVDSLANAAGYANDAFAMQLHYYDGDFSRTGSPWNSDGTSAWHMPASGAKGADLYNGNISRWSSWLTTTQGSPIEWSGYRYRYDVLNRLLEAEFANFTGTWNWMGGDYDMTARYDPNGNILKLHRQGDIANGYPMDDLTYTYAYESLTEQDSSRRWPRATPVPLRY